MHTARGDETGEAMTTKKQLQAIVRQLGLIDLGEAQLYWRKGTMEKDVNGNKRRQLPKARGTRRSFHGDQHERHGQKKERRCENFG
ncbi:hypothetical protein KSD_72090 [Ktedonobacter sp. SOSP1-85]|nr:hypothetical protein KSD_72090 [Ktedonobacter sp. SOSP1-85]